MLTSSTFYSSTDSWSTEEMVKYNELCQNMNGERKLDSSVENWFSDWIRDTKGDRCGKRGKEKEEPRNNPYSDSWVVK